MYQYFISFSPQFFFFCGKIHIKFAILTILFDEIRHVQGGMAVGMSEGTSVVLFKEENMDKECNK